MSTLPVSKRILLPRTCTIHPKLDSGGGLVGAKNNIWTTGVLAFWNLQRGRSEEDGGLQCSMITPALRSGFQFKCIFGKDIYFCSVPGFPGYTNDIDAATDMVVVNVWHQK